jgi:hypothetical protein
VVAAAAFLDTLSAPSTDGVDKVYHCRSMMTLPPTPLLEPPNVVHY